MRLSAIAASLVAFTVAIPAASADDLNLRIPKPTVGVAAAVGETYVQDNRDASTVSLEGRLAFGRLELAAEVAKSDYNDEQRVDRRLGGSIYVHLGTGSLRPLLSAGGGLLRAEHAGGLIWDMAYGQVGAGLLRRLGDNIDLSVEGVIGKRTMLRSNDVVMPLAYYRYWPEEENFGQLQLKLIVRL